MFSNVWFSSVSIQTGLSHQFEGILIDKQLSDLACKGGKKFLLRLVVPESF